MAEVESAKNTVSETQSDWATKLKHVELKDLKKVCTFSRGGYSHVSLVQLSDYPDSSFALKSVQKSKIIKPSSRRNILTEKKILSEIQNSFILELYKTFKDEKYLYFLTEYLPGGELFNLVPVPENAAKFYTACLVEALGYLHDRNIIHNDLKLENLVIGADGYAKLIDFGISEKLRCGETCRTARGTWCYFPPEVAGPLLERKPYCIRRDKASDLWALGVVVFVLLTGTWAFDTDSKDYITTCKQIMEGFDLVEFSPKYFSKEGEDFIRKLCVEDPKSRLGYESIDDVRKHRWFANFEWIELRNKTLKPPMVPELDSVVDTRNFNMDFEVDLNVEEDWSDWDTDF